MSVAHFYDPQTGVIFASFTGPENAIEANRPAGAQVLVLPERLDAALWRVDPATGEPVQREPAAPDPAAIERAARQRRAGLLSSCDWTQANDSPLDAARRAAWAQYRQALRDVTSQPGFPHEISWPEAPA